MSLLFARQQPALRRRPKRGLLWFSACVFGLLLLVALLAPVLAPYAPDEGRILESLQPPSPAHPLGTDAAGRDLLSRLIWGAQTAMLGPLIVVLLSSTAGTLLGILAAWKRGAVDSLLGRIFDIIFAFPSILLALVFVAVLATGFLPAALAVSVAFIPAVGRLVRSAALREVNQPYVEALYVQGMGPWRICIVHVLPNLLPVIVAQATLGFGYAMIDLAGISYLGLGVQEPTPDWGKMIQTGQSSIVRGYPAESLLAGGLLVVAVVSLITLGDALVSRRKSHGG